jgi:hypothetical protein
MRRDMTRIRTTPSSVVSAIACSRQLQFCAEGLFKELRSCRGVIRSFPHSLSITDFIPDRTRPEKRNRALR